MITSSKNAVPRGSIVEPTFFYEKEIVIPVVQLSASLNNIKENKNIFLHFVKENKQYYGWSTQYKINAVAKLEYSGELFESVKQFESPRLPQNTSVHAIIRAQLTKIEVTFG